MVNLFLHKNKVQVNLFPVNTYYIEYVQLGKTDAAYWNGTTKQQAINDFKYYQERGYDWVYMHRGNVKILSIKKVKQLPQRKAWWQRVKDFFTLKHRKTIYQHL